MQCPICRSELPARHALVPGWRSVTCHHCGAELRPTQESAVRVSRAVFGPSLWVGSFVGIAGMLYWLRRDNWVPGVLALVLCTLASLLFSWRVSLKHLTYERA